MEGGEEVPGMFEVESALVTVGGGDIDIGCGNAFGGGGEDEGADDSAAKENNVSGPSSFSYTVRSRVCLPGTGVGSRRHDPVREG